MTKDLDPGAIQIVVGPDKAVEVVVPNIAIEDLIALVDGYFMTPAMQGRLAAVLTDSPALTLTLTSKLRSA